VLGDLITSRERALWGPGINPSDSVNVDLFRRCISIEIQHVEPLKGVSIVLGCRFCAR
jgi:hypothetical protein